MSLVRQVTVLLLLAAAVPVTTATERQLAPYGVAVVQRFTVNPDLLKRADFPVGYEDVLQKEVFARLLSDRVFPRVLDGSQGFAGSFSGRMLAVDGEVSDFSKGNRAARIGIGYGAGSAKLKLVLVLRDMDTHEEVLRLEQTGRYAGFGNITGGSAEKARSESARKVVEALIKRIKAAR